jgi:uncharacterized protein YndB with AHSA1/START domain
MPHEWRYEGAVERDIDAAPERVYELIADVTTTGERSVECRSCEWLPGAPPGTVGSRFRGRNRSGLARWSRVCEVVAAEPGRRFAFRTVPERFDPTRADSTTWSYTLTPEGTGTRVTHSYRITREPVPPFKWLYGRLFPQHRDMRPQMAQTLDVLAAQLERPGGPGPAPSPRT